MFISLLLLGGDYKEIDLRKKEIVPLPNNLGWAIPVISEEFIEGEEIQSKDIISVEFKIIKSILKIGDDLEYEIIIKNISDQIIAIPCETNSKLVIGNYKETPPPGFETILILLYDKNEYAKQHKSIVEILLLGSELEKSSKVLLKANESFKIQGTKLFDYNNLLNNKSEQSLLIRAEVNITKYKPPLYYYSVSNSQEIILKK
jgi:hypothetical protein